MPVTSATPDSGPRVVGDLWPILIDVFPVSPPPGSLTPTVVVTKPDGSTVTADVDTVGGCQYRALYELTTTGRHLASAVVAGVGRADLAISAVEATPDAQMPQVADLNRYLGEHSWASSDLEDALDAETAAQEAVCAVPAAYPPDLRQALLRRAWRNLIMRGQPFLTVPGGEDGQISVAPTLDAEIRRFEKPHLRLLVA